MSKWMRNCTQDFNFMLGGAYKWNGVITYSKIEFSREN